ncbi:MAG: acyl-CoA dehydrogenase family protein [Deltaproteobacteria bacterium]|nr:acyl-CoA dehydrogenase family protein [Deltaproteobacteria bacterium]
MINYYKDNPDIVFHMNHMDFSRIVHLKEDNFAEKDEYAHAPKNVEDAVDNYQRVLEVIGEIAGDFIAPRARGVDEEGATYKDGEVIYAKGISESLDQLKKADLTGFTLPRKYGGINLPATVYSAAIEIISRADASLMNAFGLQSIGETIYKFGSEEQRDKYLPRFASGEVLGSMALTEPDAGSDLQSVSLKAVLGEDGKWRLNGVKRFITHGCAQISLVMARSEEGSTGGRGISLFIYDRDKNMKIRRIEHKLGIHGSPTCELQFNNAEAELLGKRKFGLVRYTMSLMNGARLAIGEQSIGIAEAAYRDAELYAKNRKQFKKTIREFPAVYEMLTDMKVNIEACRTLLYETSRIVDIKEGIEEEIEKYPDRKTEALTEELRYCTKYASLLTPMIKGYASEMANRVCYDAIQIHGGVGFTCEFDVERYYRDVRITSIYEGTTQLQALAAIGGVITGVAFEMLDEYEKENDFAEVSELFTLASQLRACLEKAVKHVKEKNDSFYQEYHAGRIVDMTTETIMSYLLCIDAMKDDRKKKVAQLFMAKAELRVKSSMEFILSNDCSVIDHHKDVIGIEESVQIDKAE